MRHLWIARCFCVLVMLVAGCGDNTQYAAKPRAPADDDETLKERLAALNIGTKKPDPTGPDVTPATAANPAAAPARTTSATITKVKDEPAKPSAVTINDKKPELDRRQIAVQRLQRIALALDAYYKKNSVYPAARYQTGAGHDVSWRVQLLPLLGYGKLYSGYRLNEPWDSPNNRQLLAQIPEVYQSIEREDEKTNFQMVTGLGTAYAAPGRMLEDDQIPDGAKSTIFVMEVSDALARPWTQPDDYLFVPLQAQSDLFSLRRDCCYAILGGGAGTRRLPADISDADLTALLTPAGGEQINADQLAELPRPDIDQDLIARLEKAPRARFATNDAPSKSDASASNAAASLSPPKVAINSPVTVAPAASIATTAKVTAPTLVQPGSTAASVADADPRWPIPPDDQLDAASAVVRDLFGADYDRAKRSKNVTDRRDFAKKMLQEAEKASADPAGSYVLLRAARDVASKAKDLETAFVAIERIARRFRVDEVAMKTEMLEQVSPQLEGHGDFDRLYQESMKLGDTALEKDDFNRARSLYRLAMSAARRKQEGRGGGSHVRTVNVRGTPNSRGATTSSTKVDDQENVVTARENRLRDTRQAYARVSSQLHTLLRDANDPLANSAVGRYFCLIKRDWDRGLPHLLRGQDETLVSLARRERALPTQADEQIALADAWWDWSEKTQVELEKHSAQLRAQRWYSEALARLEPSLIKVRAEKRIAEAKLIENPLPRAAIASEP